MDVEQIKRLKSLTGVGLTDAKQALADAKGDFDKALKAMRVKGLAKADKKSEREARAGLVDAYVHSHRIGVTVEVNCETDFVARTDDFKALVHDIAMHIAASAPTYVKRDDVSKSALDKETQLIKEELSNQKKPAAMQDKILAGKLDKWYEETTLMEQPYIKDPDITVGDYVKRAIAKLGENIVIRRFSRIELGEKS